MPKAVATRAVAQFIPTKEGLVHPLEDSLCYVNFVCCNNDYCYEIFTRVHRRLLHSRLLVRTEEKAL